MSVADTAQRDSNKPPQETEFDMVEEASEESFPASDAPASAPGSDFGPPQGPLTLDHERPLPEAVHEHPYSDPASRANVH